MLVVQGLGGLGKTALCGELLRILPKGRVLALDGRYAGAQPDPMAALWQEVQSARQDDAWSATLAGLQQHGLTAQALAGALVELMKLEGGLTVYLDDAESLQEGLEDASELGRWLNDPLREWWSLMVQLADRDGPFGFIASSRYRPEGTPEVAVLRLEPMSRWETLRLTSWMPTLRLIPHDDRDWLVEKIEGHPLTVEWLEVLAGQKARRLSEPGRPFVGEWRSQILEPIVEEAGNKIDADLLLEQVWNALDDETREHLGRTTVLSSSTPWGAVRALAPSEDVESGLVLTDTGLLSPFQGAGAEPWWAPHRLVSAAVEKLWQGDVRAPHRIVGLWFQERFEKEGAVFQAQRAVEHLCAAGDGDAAFGTADTLVLWLRRAGRYREAVGWVERAIDGGATGPKLGLLLMHQVTLLRLAGQLLVDGEERLLRALELVEHKNRGDILFGLGNLCSAQGRLSEAAGYLQQTVDFESEDKGEQSQDVAASLHSLAGVLKAQGDLSGARVHLERSLAITASVFGTEDHPSVAASLHELAGVLKAQGDLSGARVHLERSLAIQSSVFGAEDHPDVAASLHELAGVLKAQGDLSGARVHLERSLAIKSSVFGTEDHPSVATSLHQLAGVTRAQGDLSGARVHLERVIEIDAGIYGTREHYSTAQTEVDLGMLLFELGEREEGVKLIVHAYSVFQNQLGPDHPLTRQLAPLFEQSSDQD